MAERHDLIEIHVVLKKPTTPRRAEQIGKRVAGVMKIVARDKDLIERVYVSDTRGDD